MNLFGFIIFCQLVVCMKGEYCPAYYSFDNTLQPGFNCPTGVRLVGISDYYCCQNNRLNGAVFCCNDRTRSINFSNLSFGEEWITINWPILLFLGLVFCIIAVISFTAPRNAEMKDNTIEDA